MTKPIAVVLLSGGMDSTLCVAEALQAGYTPACMHINYRQRTEQRELKAFTDVCNFYNIESRLVTDIDYLLKIGGSSLTDTALAMPQANLAPDSVPITYVPFRNANILAMAVSWAEVIGASFIYIGAVEDDSSGYPDCRQSFFDAFQSVIDTGTKPETHIKIVTPLIQMTKKEIVLRAAALGAPLHLSWSCYNSPDVACGNCDSCALRLRGFQQAGIDDAIPYATKPNYAG